MEENYDPAHFYSKGCVPDAVLVLRDGKGNTLCRLRAVRAILSAWSPVLRGALELSCSHDQQQQQQQQQRDGHSISLPSSSNVHSALIHSSSSGCLAGHIHQVSAAGSSAAGLGCSSGAGGSAYVTSTGTSGGVDGAGDYTSSVAAAAAGGSVGGGCSASMLPAGMVELPVLVDHHKEVEAWKVAMCLMHPLDPTCGRSPSSLVTTCTIRPLVTLADKYNLAGLLPYAKDMLLDPRSSFGVPGIHDCYKLDALEWIQIAEGVPGFEAVVVRCVSQIVASATSSRGRSQRVAGGTDQPRYRAHEALMSAMSCLRPETCAKLAASLASCLAVACENMANQDRYSIKPAGEHTPWGWEYQYEPLRK